MAGDNTQRPEGGERLAALAQLPQPFTTWQAAKALGTDRSTAHARLKQLTAEGLVERRGYQRKVSTGRPAALWAVVAETDTQGEE